MTFSYLLSVACRCSRRSTAFSGQSISASLHEDTGEQRKNPWCGTKQTTNATLGNVREDMRLPGAHRDGHTIPAHVGGLAIQLFIGDQVGELDIVRGLVADCIGNLDEACLLVGSPIHDDQTLLTAVLPMPCQETRTSAGLWDVDERPSALVENSVG